MIELILIAQLSTINLLSCDTLEDAKEVVIEAEKTFRGDQTTQQMKDKLQKNFNAKGQLVCGHVPAIKTIVQIPLFTGNESNYVIWKGKVLLWQDQYLVVPLKKGPGI